MGCTVSETDYSTQQYFRAGPIPQQPRPSLLSSQVVDQTIKTMVWQIIEHDDVKRLAFIINKYSIDLRAEILTQKSYWTMLHLVTRFNADLCAVFLLRRMYQQDPEQYIESVNMQTIEGYTPLELAVIWNSYETYIELIQLGGIDLSLKNTVGADIFIEAKSFKRQKMLYELSQFKNDGVFLIRINIEELSKPLDFEDILIKDRKQINEIRQKRRNRNMDVSTRRHKSKNFYKIKKDNHIIILQEEIRKLVQRDLIERNEYFSRLQEISLAQDKLKELEEINKRKNEEELIRIQEQQALTQVHKIISINFSSTMIQNSDKINSEQFQRIQRQKLEYQQELKRKNEEFLRKQKQLQQQKDQKQQEQIQRQKIEEQKRLKQQGLRIEEQKKKIELKKKQEQQKIKRQLIELEQKQQQQNIQRIEKIKKEQEQIKVKKQKQELEKHKKLEEQMKKYNEQILKKQQQAVKKINEPIQVSKIQKKGKGVGTLPFEFKKLYQNSLQKGTNFIDSQFPPQRSTIGTPQKYNNTVETSKWLRPTDIFKTDYQLFDGIDPSDIKQGSLGICYYLATLSSLAENQQRIRQMFPFYDKELGFYIVNLYINGALKHIVVDDNFPCSAGNKTPLFTRPNGKQIWVMILEKAWVKNFGNYFSAEGMAADTMMQDVCGAPSKGAYFKNIIEELPFLIECQKNKFIIVLSSQAENAPKGIVAGHAYSLIDIHEKENPQLIKIRNPWGSFQWQGDYGDKSSKWNKPLKDRLKVKDEEDGIFYMTPYEVPIGFSYYSISMVQDNAKYTSCDFTSLPAEQKYWTFSLSSAGPVNIRITQLFDRLISDSSYKYSPLIFECGRIKSDNFVEFLSEGSENSIFGQKSVHFHDKLFLNLEPGQYFIRVKMFWKLKEYNTARIVTYSTLDIDLKEVKPVEIKKQWIQMLSSVLLTCNKSSLLSGNLSLMQKWMKGQYIIGVTNNSKASYEVTITLPQKDFKKCVLSYGRTKLNEVKVVVGPKETKLAAVADKTELNASSSIGKFSISAVAK